MNLIDVLICSHNEAEHLPRVLDSLRAQTIGTDRFRVIVVDNASIDNTSQVVQQHAAGLNLHYIFEPQPGLNVARNTGYQQAHADYVAHLDADARADPRWLEVIQRVIQQQQPDLCGGPYFPFYLTDKPRWFLDRYNADDHGSEVHALRADEQLNGTNMVWKRSFVEQLGGFNPKVGLTGRGLARGDETNLIQRARRTGGAFKAIYHPEIVVYHLTRPETFSLRYWTRRSLASGRNTCNVSGTPAEKRSRGLRLAQLVIVSARVASQCLTALVGRNPKRYPYWQNYYYECVLPELGRLGRVWESLLRGH